MGMTEGVITEWIREVGETVAKGDPLVEVDTAKATAELESPVAGKLVEVLVDEDAEVPVGDVVCIIETDG
jgi:2-oxoglutarate dehydrogenase E2 component (dihydrolipoamide succinyltransferase)